MLYRKWVYEDIFWIAAIEKKCFSDPWTFQMLADTFFNDRALKLAAEEEGSVVGYGFCMVAGEEADLADLAVESGFRRRGIAAALLRQLEEGARSAGAKRMFLEVRVSNAAAMRLYLKAGYVGRYARPRYYGDGEDALVMEKVL